MNPDPTAPFYRQNLMYALCKDCEREKHCPKSGDYPVISPLSRYILQYLSEISDGFSMYPNQGSWEDQPAWFIQLLNVARATRARKERSEIDAKRHGSTSQVNPVR